MKPTTPPPLATALVLAAAALVLAPPRAAAGPTVIRDEMLRDTAITPSLGRGYSISTNTFQSNCLTNVVRTKPSYNFDYHFDEMKDDGSVSRTYSRSTSWSGSGGWFSRWSASSSTRYDESTRTTWHKHRMLVTILIDVYYSAVDESQSKMSPAAASLLTNKDIPGFFDACGMYYVRSISRQAALISLFTYESTEQKRNTSFENSLQSSVRSFWGSSSNYSESTKTTTDFAQTVSNLSIETHAIGLGKNESADIIAYDVGTFRNAVKSAFQSTQPDEVGMVTAIEVAPWIENTEFQALNRLEPVLVPVVDELGMPVMDLTDPQNPKQKIKTVMPYAQKRMLSQNAEFLAELDRAGRAKLNVFYKARMCRAQINLDYMTQNIDEGTWKFSARDVNNPDAGDNSLLPIVNNRTAQDWISMGDIYNDLSDDKLQRLWMEYDAFMYGGTGKDVDNVEKDPKERAAVARAILLGTKPELGYPKNVFPGAEACVADLIEKGITVKSHRDVKACQRVEETFGTIAGQRVDDYCPVSTGAPPAKAGGSLVR